MSFLTELYRMSKAVAIPAGKIGMGGTAGRVAAGAFIGGMYGAITNPYNDTNISISRIAKSAIAGGMIGGATRLFTPSVRFGANGTKISGMPLGLKALGRLGKSAPGVGFKVGVQGAKLAGLILRHPVATLGVAGGVYGIYQANKTPYDSNLAQSVINQPFTNNQNDTIGLESAREAQMIDQMSNSIVPMGSISSGSSIRNQRLMESTMGLVQGLSRGRHS